MGHAANLIIVERNRYSLYYTHWAANRLHRDLFWGPDHAIAFIRAQREVDGTGWLNEIWAEGGAVIDTVRSVLLLFGGEDVRFYVPLRRVYLDLLRRSWRGWEVRWAHEEIADIAEYVGYPREKVLTPDDDDPEDITCSLSPPREKDSTNLVGSVLGDAQIRLFPLAGHVADCLRSGPRLLTACATEPGLNCLPLDQWTKDFPIGGFHIDACGRTVDFWTGSGEPDIQRRIGNCWPDWTVRWHRDEYEFQLEVTKGYLQFPVQSRQQLEARLAEMLLCESDTYGLDVVRVLAERERQAGRKAEINPWASRDDQLELPVQVRREILASVLRGSEASR